MEFEVPMMGFSPEEFVTLDGPYCIKNHFCNRLRKIIQEAEDDKKETRRIRCVIRDNKFSGHKEFCVISHIFDEMKWMVRRTSRRLDGCKKNTSKIYFILKYKLTKC